MRTHLPRQLLSYVLIGLLQLAFDSLAFVALTVIGLDPLIANPFARASAAGLGFVLNGAYTFAQGGQRRLSWAHLARFLLVWIGLTALGTALIAFADRHAGLHAAWLAKPFIELLLAIAGFTMQRHWVFRAPATPLQGTRAKP